MNKFVIYTAVFGNYLPEIISAPTECDCVDFICFTDNCNLRVNNWRIILVDAIEANPIVENRKYKILPHLFLKEYEWAIYIDANIKIIKCPESLFYKYMKSGNKFFLPAHFSRDCLYQEAIECIALNRGDSSNIAQQIKYFKKKGMPKKFGLTENGVLIRKIHDVAVIQLMESWWTEFNRYASLRDQLALPYAMWQSGHQMNLMEESVRNLNGYFEYSIHPNRKALVKNGRIYFYLKKQVRKIIATLWLY